MKLDATICWEALKARDARFDGRFFTGVVSTGIFCRPVCPARTPLQRNCRFYPSAAAALSEGFRPCLRCRPETAPGSSPWNGTSAAARRALRLIEEGALDGGSVAGLAARVGLGERQLRRIFLDTFGATPVAVAQTRRVLLARKLLRETALPTADVSAAAGFGSLRRFREALGPLDRRKAGEGKAIRLRLAYRPPYDWPAMLDFFRVRAVAGVEEVSEDSYARTFRVGGVQGRLRLRPVAGEHSVEVEMALESLTALPRVVAGVRRLFDLDADPLAIADGLQSHPALAERLAARPGLRLPGAWDAFEMSVRATLEQQVTPKGAATLTSRLVALAGPATPDGERLFPTAEELLGVDLSGMGLTGARRRALAGLAEAFEAERIPLDGPVEAIREALEGVSGVGPWTSHYIALRACGDPDAFPPKDLGLRRVFGGSDAELLQAAEAWRPWRAYAAMHLWTPLPL
ncbi:MAG: helix-turn-helix domain-containing protein [Acidobacteria bacterium]|nr:helix-turn-helix domain-containing protein [Acidobacteriota bacterium]